LFLKDRARLFELGLPPKRFTKQPNRSLAPLEWPMPAAPHARSRDPLARSPRGPSRDPPPGRSGDPRLRGRSQSSRVNHAHNVARYCSANSSLPGSEPEARNRTPDPLLTMDRSRIMTCGSSNYVLLGESLERFGWWRFRRFRYIPVTSVETPSTRPGSEKGLRRPARVPAVACHQACSARFRAQRM
jgi:hypothetical protein